MGASDQGETRYPLRRVPRPPGGTKYDEWPDHPLAGTPQGVLDVARQVLEDCVSTGDVHESMAHPIADAVVQVLKEAGYLRDHSAGSEPAEARTRRPRRCPATEGGGWRCEREEGTHGENHWISDETIRDKRDTSGPWAPDPSPNRCWFCHDDTEKGDDPQANLCAMCAKAGRQAQYRGFR